MPEKKTTSAIKVSSNEQEQIINQKPMKKIGSLFILILLLLVVVSGALAIYFYWQWSELKANPQAAAQQEGDALVGRVSKLIVLPEGEAPTIATVTDPERLKEQPFFSNAKKGDKVLIYTNARKAILYDPVNNKIVEVAPVNIGNPQPASSAGEPSPSNETSGSKEATSTP